MKLLRPIVANHRRSPGRALPAIVLFVLALVALVGCGGSSSVSGSSSGASSQETARLQASKCMRQHGVNLPAPSQQTGAGPGSIQSVPQQTLQAAQNACQKYLSKAAGNFNPNSTAFQDAFVKFSACMRKHGIDIPSQTGSGTPDPGQITQLQQQPGFQQASQACQSNLPQGGPAGGPTG